MRILPLLVALAVSSPASAGGFAELGGGLMFPVADNDWSDAFDPGAKLFVRGGAIQGRLGGMVSLDWSPLNYDTNFPAGFDLTANRFRLLAHLVTDAKSGPRLTLSGRFGLGVDIVHVSVDSILGSDDDTDSGFALEAGGALWYDVGAVEIGGQLALPISFHGGDYTSLDVDILFGLRFMAH